MRQILTCILICIACTLFYVLHISIHNIVLQRTAGDIAAAYEARQAAKALEGPELEGLEGWIAKAKNFYFFGLFEGETGQQAPWFLRPSITFPIAFLIVGAAFWVSYISGAISERGASVTDELDEVILSSTATQAQVLLAALLMNDGNLPL